MPARFLNFQRTAAHHEKSSLPCLDLLSYLLSEIGIFFCDRASSTSLLFFEKKLSAPSVDTIVEYLTTKNNLTSKKTTSHGTMVQARCGLYCHLLTVRARSAQQRALAGSWATLPLTGAI